MKANHSFAFNFLAGAFLLLSTLAGARGQVYQKVFSFTTDAEQSVTAPVTGASLILGSDGNFYGSMQSPYIEQFETQEAYGLLVFKMTPNGVVTPLAQTTFLTNNDFFDANGGGALPHPLVQGVDGNFYGVVTNGGISAENEGEIYEVTPSGVLTHVSQAGGSTFAPLPIGGLVQDNNGAFYGVTAGLPETTQYGTVFEMAGGSVTTLVTFTGTGANSGTNPVAGLAQDVYGNLYGTTSTGGANNAGTVFQMTASGTLTTLVQFTGTGGGNPGSYPAAALIQGGDGNFYGTTQNGGTGNFGTVFKVTPAGAMTTLAEFTGSNGANPVASLVEGGDGNFYGTTEYGGASNAGTIFKVTSSGTLSTLVQFTGTNGGNPVAGLVVGVDGNFYGIAGNQAFKMTPAGGITPLAVISAARLSAYGTNPYGLVQGTNGNLYGLTNSTVFQVSPAGVLDSVVTFTGTGGPFLGGVPSTLAAGSNGNVYGTTPAGGANNDGTVFEMTPGGDVTTLVQFSGTGTINTGSDPNWLVQGNDGNIYGTTCAGGAYNAGTLFQMTPSGNLTTLVQFSGTGTLGGGPACLVQGTDGYLYGVTTSAEFRITYSGTVTPLVQYSYTGIGPPTLLPLSSNSFSGATSGTEAEILQITPTGVGGYSLGFFASYGDVLEGGGGRISFSGYLTQGSNGMLFGTASNGGRGIVGGIFELLPEYGVLVPLLQYGVDDFPNPYVTGGAPLAALTQGSDGTYYGTTYADGFDDSSGDLYGGGTLFQMIPPGPSGIPTINVLYDFTNDPYDEAPKTQLIAGSDGNLYGTTSGGTTGSGSIYRILFPGAPNIYAFNALVDGTTSVLVSAQVIPKGAITSVIVASGTDGVNFPNIVGVASNVTTLDNEPTTVGTTLTNLSPGTLYYYYFQAASSSGTTVTPVQTFVTLEAPAAALGAVTNLTAASVQLNGIVNAENYPTSVEFQYGTDGNTFPDTATTTPTIVTGGTDTTVTASISPLEPGVTYYYRIEAINEGGTTISGQGSFTAPLGPTENIGGALALSSTGALVSGTVNANGSATYASFFYGTGTNVASYLSVPAYPTPVTGTTATMVTGTLGPLSQNMTYYYFLSGTNAGGATTSGTASFTPIFLSATNQVFPDSAPAANGFLLVNTTPAGLAGEGWHFVGESIWRLPGVPVGGLASGDYAIEFEPIPGYLQPPYQEVLVTSGSAAAVVNAEYYESPNPENICSISVNIEPAALTNPALTGSNLAQWQIVGQPGLLQSGTTVSGLPEGVYTIQFTQVPGQTTPAPVSVSLTGTETSADITGIYLVSGSQVGTVPSPVPFSSIATGTGLPYAFVGQILSDQGEATGFIVMSQVVATAAHVVYDDASNSWATGLQWLFQRDAGTYEPVPILPAGSFTISGYSAERASETTPGVSSPQSEDLDVAAMYFTQYADGRNGSYGGYLASDSTPNEYLTSSALMTLVGYPVDGIPVNEQGQMFATPAQNINFVPELTGTTDANTGLPYRLYTTQEITAAGGASGGPLCVQLADGNYYPAAVYLGGDNDSVVRAIDSNVISIFTEAETAAESGTNHLGGGEPAPITRTAGSPGGITIALGPPAAVAAGAKWELDEDDNFKGNGVTLNNLTPGFYEVEFASVPGYNAPAPQVEEVDPNKVESYAFNYIPLVPVITSATAADVFEGVPFSYQIKAKRSATSFSFDNTLPLGLTLDGTTGLISGTVPTTYNAGPNPVVVAIKLEASNAEGTGKPFTLYLSVGLPGILTVTINGNGAVTKGLAGPSLRFLNSMVTIKATPERGNLFADWTDADMGNVLFNEEKYTFPMPALLDLQANFVVNPFLTAQGTYLALLDGTTYNESGYAELKVKSNGSFTGVFDLGGVDRKVHGDFSSLGQYTGMFSLPGGDTYATGLSLTGAGVLTGTLTDQSDNSQLVLTTEKTAPRADQALAGTYTAVLPAVTGTTGLPGGNGFGTLKISKKGAVVFSGKLGDGVPVTISGNLEGNGVWPFLFTKSATKTAGTELLLGPVTFPPPASGTVGTLNWYRSANTKDSVYPNGFSTEIPILISPYETPAVNYTPADVTFSGADLTVPVAETATIDITSKDHATPASGDTTPFSLKFTSGSGLFSGSFPDNGVDRKFSGSVLQSGSFGMGLFEEKSGQTGSVLLTPAP